MLKPDPKRLKKALWWDKNWGILEGCTKVSPGCRSCFAEDYVRRFATTLPYLKGLTDKDGHWTGKVNLRPELLNLPFETKTPAVWFVAERSDLFHDAVPDYFIHDALNAIGTASHHTFLLLTKRPDRMAEVLRDHYESALINPYTNLWVGTTAENPEQFNRRSRFLLQTPAYKHFLSVEPMLDPISIYRLSIIVCENCGDGARFTNITTATPCLYCGQQQKIVSQIDWVICGGESGSNARPVHPKWVEYLQKQCEAVSVPFFFKQWGEWLDFQEATSISDIPITKIENSEIHTFNDGTEVIRIGKKYTGRLLNGKTYLEWPE